MNNEKFYKFKNGCFKKSCYEDIVCVTIEKNCENSENKLDTITMFNIHIITQKENSETYFVIPSRSLKTAQKEVDEFVKDIEKKLSIREKENADPNCVTSELEG